MSERLGIYSETELQAARELMRELVRLVRSWRLYAGNHPTLTQLQRGLRRQWEAATAGGPLTLRFQGRRVLLQEEDVYRSAGGSEVIPEGLHEHGIAGLVLHRGLEPGEQERLLRVLAEEPGPAIDYAALLWEADLKHVQILLDDEDEGESIQSPQQFALQVARLGEAADPSVGPDYDEERQALAAAPAAPAPGGDAFAFEETDAGAAARALADDTYVATVRHALRMAHRMARDELDAEEAAALETSLRALVGAVASSGDLEAAIEVITRAHGLLQSAHPLEMRVGEATLALLHEPERLWAFLRRMDEEESVDARLLGEFFVQLGKPAAATIGEWLMETAHPQAVSDAMRVYGETATEILVPLYTTGGAAGRERAGPALLEIGTPEALSVLAAEFDQLPRPARLQLVQVAARSREPGLRALVLRALDDVDEPVRREAVGALRRQDAPALVPVVEDFFDRGVFETRYREETEEFFEMLSRVGNGKVARILAERCLPKGFRLGFRRLSDVQALCVRALRRMRSHEARPVVEELKRSGPRAVRDILESPLGELE